MGCGTSNNRVHAIFNVTTKPRFKNVTYSGSPNTNIPVENINIMEEVLILKTGLNIAELNFSVENQLNEIFALDKDGDGRKIVKKEDNGVKVEHPIFPDQMDDLDISKRFGISLMQFPDENMNTIYLQFDLGNKSLKRLQFSGDNGIKKKIAKNANNSYETTKTIQEKLSAISKSSILQVSDTTFYIAGGVATYLITDIKLTEKEKDKDKDTKYFTREVSNQFFKVIVTWNRKNETGKGRMQFEELKNIPGSVIDCCMIEKDGWIYLIGGLDCKMKNIEGGTRYNVKTQEWNELPPIQKGNQGYMKAFIYKEAIYILTQFGEVYHLEDGNFNSWIFDFKIPFKLKGFELWQAGPNNLLVVMGTEDDYKPEKAQGTANVLKLDIKNKTFQYSKNLMTPRVFGCCWPSDKGFIILGGNHLGFISNCEENSKKFELSTSSDFGIKDFGALHMHFNLRLVSSSIQNVLVETGPFKTLATQIDEDWNENMEDLCFSFFNVPLYRYDTMLVFNKHNYKSKLYLHEFKKVRSVARWYDSETNEITFFIICDCEVLTVPVMIQYKWCNFGDWYAHKLPINPQAINILALNKNIVLITYVTSKSGDQQIGALLTTDADNIPDKANQITEMNTVDIKNLYMEEDYEAKNNTELEKFKENAYEEKMPLFENMATHAFQIPNTRKVIISVFHDNLHTLWQFDGKGEYCRMIPQLLSKDEQLSYVESNACYDEQEKCLIVLRKGAHASFYQKLYLFTDGQLASDFLDYKKFVSGGGDIKDYMKDKLVESQLEQTKQDGQDESEDEDGKETKEDLEGKKVKKISKKRTTATENGMDENLLSDAERWDFAKKIKESRHDGIDYNADDFFFMNLDDSEKVKYNGVVGYTYISNNKLHYLNGNCNFTHVNLQSLDFVHEKGYFEGIGTKPDELLRLALSNPNLIC